MRRRASLSPVLRTLLCCFLLVGTLLLAAPPAASRAAQAPAAPVAPVATATREAADFPLHPLLRGAVPPPADDGPLRLVHMTDTHVIADGKIQNAVDTAANLRVAIAAINALEPRPHLVAVTGDLTLDSADGLWVFKRLMERLEVPYFPIPGNHDKVLRGRACEAMFASLGFPLHYSFDYAGRHFVAIDAEEERKHEVRGHISERQMDWLRKDLEEHRGMETLLFVHQHPLGDEWNSPNTFAENVPLLRAIRENPQVGWVFNGHSHDDRFLELDGTRFVTTSATAYIFGRPPLPFDQHGSGFRVLDFPAKGGSGGSVTSFFANLSGGRFPDPAPDAYLSAERDPESWVKAYGRDSPAYVAPPAGPHVLVALCQVPCVDSALEENLKVVEEAAREAAGRGAKVLCFPESMDLGWVNVRAHELAAPIPGPTSDRIAALARDLGVHIAIGLTERVEGGICDTAILVGPRGDILLEHRKINTLVELLTPPYIRGRVEDIAVADTPLGRMGLLICADTFEDGILDAMRALKPDLLLVPYGWAAPPAQWPGHGEELKKTVSRAARVVGAPVIGPSSIGEITSGPWKGRTYRGESAAADREGTIIVFGLTGRRQVAVFPVALPPRETSG